MAKLKRTSSGLWTTRKVIPLDVREAYGRREEKPTWPSSLTQAQARAEFGAWLLKVEERIAALRSTTGGPAINLTHRQSLALAAKWYEEMKGRYEDDPGSAEGWEAEAAILEPEETAETYLAYQKGDPNPTLPPWQITPFLRDEVAALLMAERLRITGASLDKLLQDMAELYHAFCALMIQRAHGDYSNDRRTASLPKWEGAAKMEKPKAASALPIMDLFDAYVAERKPAPATVKSWRLKLDSLTGFLGHDDASKITGDDIVRWKDHLTSTPTKQGKLRAAKTIRETYIAAVRTVFAYAKDNRKIAENPSDGVKVRGAKRQRLRDPGFTQEEAEMILRATLQTQPGQLAPSHAFARRWVPWLCAYTGARVGEITQLRKQDVIQEDGVWAINITPEAGSTKTNAARKVPLHSHLIEQGFLQVVEKAEKETLFYDPKRSREGGGGNPQHKKTAERLGKWVRELGVDDPNVQPNHAWRHRFKTVARSVRMDTEARAVIPGHAPGSEGEAYGSWTLPDLATELEKLPRYELVGSSAPDEQA